ncbi:hypothetical protein JAAARDRAFT_32915 [Jaapia argillacea MUCL 33604]|uniref:F-box domain-containing protein n=1 Tax=Jaapia argillacea MUCL 33604 TaxID=933084 RepID=A0A067Q0M9_9AGAM|nr:hypothetical protein JAAARDRAFT_32915 [Jaapia argillacea MUCL 33604]
MSHLGCHHHRALLIAEICREICWHLKGDWQKKRWNRSLARLAQCSRAFSDPALDVLWHEMSDLEPLIGLIPAVQRVTVEGSEDDEEFEIFKLIGPTISDDDWRRFDLYASRIRVYRYDHDDPPDRTLCRQLAVLKGRALLPSLKTVIYSLGERSDGVEMRADIQGLQHLSESIRSFTTKVSSFYGDIPNRGDHQGFWDSVPDSLPHLQHFELAAAWPIVSIDFFGQFRDIRFIKIQVQEFWHFSPVKLRGNDFDTLSSLPLLESLTLRHFTLDEWAGKTSQNGFPSLRVLEMAVPGPAGLQSILAAISSTSMTTLAVRITESRDWDAIRACIISAFRFNVSLENLDWVVVTGMIFTQDVLNAGAMAAIMPLFLTFRNLKRFVSNIWTPHVFESFDGSPPSSPLTPAEATSMALRWPRLETFILRSDFAFFSLDSFVAFISSSPLLTHLVVDKILVDRHPCAVMALLPSLSHGMDSLWVRKFIQQWTNEPDDLPLAICLFQLFPRLDFAESLPSCGSLKEIMLPWHMARGEELERAKHKNYDTVR